MFVYLFIHPQFRSIELFCDKLSSRIYLICDLQKCRIVDENEVEVGESEVEVSGELRIKVSSFLLDFHVSKICCIQSDKRD